MLYAAVTDRGAWPLGAEELEYLEERLRRLNFAYQVGMEMRMLNTAEYAPVYRFVLLKWDVVEGMKKRNVLLETHDIEQMASALKMLVSIEENEAKQRS